MKNAPRKITVHFVDGTNATFDATKWVTGTESGVISIEKHYTKNEREYYDVLAHVALQQVKYIEGSIVEQC